MPKITYETKQFRDSTLDIIAQAEGIIKISHRYQRDCQGKRDAAKNVEVLQQLIRRL